MGKFEESFVEAVSDIDLGFSGVVHGETHRRDGTSVVRSSLRIRGNQLVFHGGSLDVSGVETTWEFVEGTSLKPRILSLPGVKFPQILAHVSVDRSGWI